MVKYRKCEKEISKLVEKDESEPIRTVNEMEEVESGEESAISEQGLGNTEKYATISREETGFCIGGK